MKRNAKENQVMKFNAKVWLERIGFNSEAVKVRLKVRDGWAIPLEWVSVQSAREGHAKLAKERPWEAASHYDVINALRGFS